MHPAQSFIVTLAAFGMAASTLARPVQEQPQERPAPTPAPTPAQMRAQMQAMVQARHIAMGVTMYNSQHGSLPPSIKALTDMGIMPPQGQAGADPANWVVDGVAYTYLGVDGVAMEDVPDWGDIAIAHRDLATPVAMRPTPDNPEGAGVPVVFLDGHVETVSLAEARWLIDDARATFAALKGDAPLPMHRQLDLDAARLAQAMLRYAARHNGQAPPDWAATVDHLPPDPRAPDQSEADRLRIYLPPAARQTTFIPEFDDRAERDAWVNANSMWRTPADGANIQRVPGPTFTLLVYARPDAWVQAPDRRQRKHVRQLAWASVAGNSALTDPNSAAERARDAEATFDSIRTGQPLPPLDDALHDLRLLGDAIIRYAKDHEGLLPPDLGEVMPYVDGLWGVYERQPARIFLHRAHETAARIQDMPDAQWIRDNASYVYLGDARLTLQDLRGSGAMILLHAPLDEPFAMSAFGIEGDFVPVAPPRFQVSAVLDPTAATVLPADAADEQAQASRAAIDTLAGN